MKRTAAFFIILSIAFSLSFGDAARTADAESYTYARVVSDGAVFYSDAALAFARFTLPKSYYVKVVNIGIESSRVIYMESNALPIAEGYVKNADLFFTDQTPIDPYPSLTLTVAVDEVMFADVSRAQPKCVLAKNSVAYYYGEIISAGETYLYVYALGNVGYVKKTSFEDFSVPMHPSYAIETENTSVEDSTKSSYSKEELSSVGTVTTAQVIIIALLIVGVLCMLFLLLRPEQKLRKKDAYYDED